VSVAPQNHPASEAPAGPVPSAGGTRVAENLILLTRDESLIEALVNVVPEDCLTVVADESALAHHLLSGHTGVVFIDAGAVSSRPGMAAQLTQRLHHQLPDVVLVAAGDGMAQGELAALVTDGTIYRFVHKPVSAQRVKLFVEAAWRKRDGSASGAYPILSMSQLAPITPMTRAVPWPSIGAAVVVIAATLAWYLLRSPSPPGAEAPALTAAPAAPRVPRVTVTTVTTDASAPIPATHAPATKPADLDRLATAAEQALMSGNLAEATRLTDAARAVDPDHVRVKFLTAQLAREQARVNARRRAAEAAAAPVPTESAPASAAAPLPAPPPAALPVVTAAPLPPAATGTDAPPIAGTPAAATVSSSPELVGPPSSTPPVSEARDRNSVAAIILHREYAPDPEFPELARERDLSGYVDLEFTVNSDGSVADVTVLKSQPYGVFDRSAVAAVRQWRYRPLSRDGVPVSEHARLRLNFAYK
jgi:protein TonB